MTFCFARNLSDKQHAQFQKQLVGRHPGVLVDFWDLAEILLRLDSSEAGKRIARHYFTDSVRDRELMLRTIRAGGDLAPANKLIERALPIGETTARNDPFFEYPPGATAIERQRHRQARSRGCANRVREAIRDRMSGHCRGERDRLALLRPNGRSRK
jgi:hypothetical protein